MKPRVLMVTGAYHPETSGASLQCRQLIRGLRNQAEFVVLTTTLQGHLPARDRVDGIDVIRIHVDPQSGRSTTSAAGLMTRAFLGLRSRFDIIHLHGFSRKTMLLIALARAFGKRVVIKLTSYGHDDALTVKRQRGTAFRFYRRADRFIAVSPVFEQAHREAGIRIDRYRMVPNGVDLERFQPANLDEQRMLRASFGIRPDRPMVLFVGFFSHEKRPDLLYQAWARLLESGMRATLVFVGASRSPYYEIDPAMAEGIRDDAARRGVGDRLLFVEHTTEIEKFYRAADIFALPTLREGLPNVLLEAMASGVPPVITRLPGVTDWIVEHGVTGLLVPPNDEDALTGALRELLASDERREAIGAAARAHVAQRFAAAATAAETLSIYRELCAA